jgi:sulfane dehydrogenase subunit SoxC
VTDDIGYVQPTREKMIADRGSRTIYHSNAVTTWGVSEKGEVKHVYA